MPSLTHATTYILFIVTCVRSARILAYFPTPSISHQFVFRPLTQALAKNGHQVVIVTPDPAFPKGQAPPNITEIDVHDMSYKIWKEKLHATRHRIYYDDYCQHFELTVQVVNMIMEKQFRSTEVQKLVNDKNNQFDLLILEAYAKQLLVFQHIYKAPVIQMSSLGATFSNYHSVGAPIHEVLYPISIRRKIYNLTTYGKFVELYRLLKMQRFVESFESEEQAMVKRVFGDDVPPFGALLNNVDMLFLNIHPIWEGLRPTPPSVVHISGISKKKARKLPENIKSYLDSSKHGVIYISFGTNVNTTFFSQETIQIMTKVFSGLPYDVLWKWDSETLPMIPKNVKLMKWFPQADLLKHPKVKLFITQGGLQSTDEAIDAGVPLIGIPMLLDQWYNCEKYVHHGIGMQIDIDTLTENEFWTKINTVIVDKSYRKNIRRLRRLMQDEPQGGLEKAVWWTEYVLRHGGAKHLRSPAANITWAEYIELELLVAVLTAIIASCAAILLCLRRVCKKTFSGKGTRGKIKKHKLN